MKISIIFFLIFSLVKLQENDLPHSQPFDKHVFYKTLSSGNLIQLDEQLILIKTVSLPYREAYEGTLLMKKAGLMDNKITKLSIFKTGKLKLDSIILTNNENCEFRLLRLMIQENAPLILGYNKQINEDCILIQKKFKSSESILQNIILDYSKKSGKLKVPRLLN